jgi:hypothetical protein
LAAGRLSAGFGPPLSNCRFEVGVRLPNSRLGSIGRWLRGCAALSVDTTDDLHLSQKQKVLPVLEREAFNKAKAARALGISRRELYRLLEKYGLADSAIAAP